MAKRRKIDRYGERMYLLQMRIRYMVAELSTLSNAKLKNVGIEMKLIDHIKDESIWLELIITRNGLKHYFSVNGWHNPDGFGFEWGMMTGGEELTLGMLEYLYDHLVPIHENLTGRKDRRK